jgi:hypothetical protein
LVVVTSEDQLKGQVIAVVPMDNKLGVSRHRYLQEVANGRWFGQRHRHVLRMMTSLRF